MERGPYFQARHCCRKVGGGGVGRRLELGWLHRLLNLINSLLSRHTRTPASLSLRGPSHHKLFACIKLHHPSPPDKHSRDLWLSVWARRREGRKKGMRTFRCASRRGKRRARNFSDCQIIVSPLAPSPSPPVPTSKWLLITGLYWQESVYR